MQPGFNREERQVCEKSGCVKRGVDQMQLEWDERKAASNERKHGVSFHEAATVFGDPLAITFPDPDHSEYEHRFITFGMSHRGRLLMIAHADRGVRLRVISARLMTKKERKIYEEG